MIRLLVLLALATLSHQCDVSFTYAAAGGEHIVQACHPQVVCATVAPNQQHNAQLVTQQEYDTCNIAYNTAPTYSAGQTIQLVAPHSGDTDLYACSIPGHCASGAKIQVQCAASGASSTTAPAVSAARRDATRGPHWALRHY